MEHKWDCQCDGLEIVEDVDMGNRLACVWSDAFASRSVLWRTRFEIWARAERNAFMFGLDGTGKV